MSSANHQGRGPGQVDNREVEVRPRLGNDPAQLVDILVHAIPFGADGLPAAPVTVVVEVKCAWNNGVMLEMERQLYDRYLKNSDLHFGIYVLAYFTCDIWNSPRDDRKTSGKSGATLISLRKALSAQAAALTNSEKSVECILLDARLTAPSASSKFKIARSRKRSRGRSKAKRARGEKMRRNELRRGALPKK